MVPQSSYFLLTLICCLLSFLFWLCWGFVTVCGLSPCNSLSLVGLSCPVACEILSPDQGLTPRPLRWKHRVLTPGTPGEPLITLWAALLNPVQIPVKLGSVWSQHLNALLLFFTVWWWFSTKSCPRGLQALGFVFQHGKPGVGNSALLTSRVGSLG